MEEWSKLETAKQLFETVGYEYNQEEFGDDDDNNDGEVDVFNPNEFDLNDLNIQPANEEQQPIQDIDKAANDLLGIRLNVRQNQEKQAETMRTRSKKYLPEVNIGDFVIFVKNQICFATQDATVRILIVRISNNLHIYLNYYSNLLKLL